MHNEGKSAVDGPSLQKAVRRAAVPDGQRLTLSCERAHRLAAELNVDVRRIGAICQAENIKIVHCQLGCFGGPRHERPAR